MKGDRKDDFGIGFMLDGTLDIFSPEELARRVAERDEAERALAPEETDISDLQALGDLFDNLDGTGTFDNHYDVPSGAVASKSTPGLTYIDNSLPRYNTRFRNLDGKLADIWRYLAIRAQTEQRGGASLQRERENVEKDCGSKAWPLYRQLLAEYLDRIVQKRIVHPPPD